MADQTTPAPSTNTSAGGDQSGHTPLTYRVEMTMAWFRDVYKQQNMAYYRKMGIFCLVFGIPLTLVSLYILISDPSETTLESIGGIALFGALSVMGVMMMQGKGIMMRTRKGELSSFFATHGMPNPHGPYSLEDLHCEYDVTVRDLGFEEAVTFENGLKLVTKQPWVVLTGKGGEAQGGYTFAANDGKNSSLWYNMLGINALIREGLESTPLVVPRAVENQNPWLVAWISNAIESQRTAVKGKGGGSDQLKEKISAWAGVDAYLPDGRKADPTSSKDSEEVNRLLEE